MDKLFCFALLCHLFHPYAVAAPAQVAIKPDPDHFTVHALDNLSTVPVHDLAFSAPNAWPGATISYNFDSAATESSLGAEVNTAISRWTVSAPYLRFVKIPNSGVGSKGILTITANACKGCNTGIFGYANQPLAMNLQQGCLLTPGTCGPDQATHEFGHALGTSRAFSCCLGKQVTKRKSHRQVLYTNTNALIERHTCTTRVKISNPAASTEQPCLQEPLAAIQCPIAASPPTISPYKATPPTILQESTT